MTGRHEHRGASPVPILMYHSISDRAAPGFRKFVVSPAAFAEQMTYLARRDYSPLTVTQFVASAGGAGEPLPERPVLLTFDDGFADFYSQALPVLEGNGFTATLYVCTAFVDGTSRWLQREGEGERPMLTWEQLRDISALGVECGAHGHTHAALDAMSTRRARQEILRPREILEDKLACRISSFAYPFGYYTQAVRQIVRECGYSSACAVRYGMSSTGDDPFALARMMVTHDTDINHFAGLLEGRRTPDLIVQRARATIWRLVRHAAYRGRVWVAMSDGAKPECELGERSESATKGY